LSPAASAFLGRRIVARAELHPDHLGQRRQFQRFLDHRHDVAGVAEDVDHVDRAVDIGERSDKGFPHQRLADVTGIDRGSCR